MADAQGNASGTNDAAELEAKFDETQRELRNSSINACNHADRVIREVDASKARRTASFLRKRSGER